MEQQLLTCLWLTAAVSVLVAFPVIADVIEVRAVQLKQTDISIEMILQMTNGLAPQFFRSEV